MSTTTNQTALQRYQVTQVAGGPVGVARQALHEVITYSVEYSGWLETGDTIQSVLVDIGPQTIPALEVVNTLVVDQNAVQFSVRKGVDDTAYNIVFTIQTKTGQTKQDVLELTVGERDDYSGPTSSRVFDRISIGADLDARFKLFAYLNDAKILARPQSDGGTGDARYFLDREDIDTEAAVYHQTGGTSHARTGLLHDDSSSAPNAYFIQVSDDGVNWKTGLEIDAATGVVKFPAGVTLPQPGTGVLGGVMTEPGRDHYYVRGLGADGRLILMPFLPPTDTERGMVYAGGPKFNHYVSAITFDGKVQLTEFDPPTSTKLGSVFAGIAPLGQVMTGIGWDGRPVFDNPNGIFVGVFPQDPTITDVGVSAWPIKTGSIYYNTTNMKPMVWTGVGWEDFWAPAKSFATILYYRTTPQQTDFFLGDTDLFQNNYTVDPIDTEPVEVFVNGVRLTPDDDQGYGDYTLDNTTNTITINAPLAEDSAVTIVILTPAAKLAPSSVTIYPLVDFDTDPFTLKPGRIDGTRTMFSMATVAGKPGVNVASAAELLVTCNGGLLKPGIDYTATGSTITFMQPPDPSSLYWAEWLMPGAGGSSANGVLPPVNPDDLHTNAYNWHPVSLGGKGGEWRDNRGDVHSVANQVARLALNDPAEIVAGALVYERDTKNLWVYSPAGATAPTGGAAGGTGTTGTGTVATGRTDINLTAGDPTFKTKVLALKVGDTVFFNGQYYRVTQTPTLGEESFPGGTSYAINPAPFTGQFTPSPGPAWNNYLAPTTPGMANPGTTTATGTTAAAPAATPGNPALTSSWTLLLPGHPTDQILRALEYDPSKPNSMAWEDNRDEMETVNAEADLYNPTVLPPSHLTVGKLVYVKATGQLWESLVDGTTGTITNTIADWKPLGGAGVTYVGRIGNLPDPTVKTVPDGSLFMVNMDLSGNDYHRLYVFDAQGTNAAGVVGVYRPCAARDFIKALRSDADVGLDAEVGDLQVTLENGHKELKVADATGAMQMVYSEDQVKQWIAAGNLFQGTAEDKGHGTVGSIDLDKLPAQSALGITDAGHYYIYVGAAGHVIAPNEVGGAASNIDGAKLNVGDWILVANTGTPAAPVMKYTHVPGDLLAKSRGDNLYGLNNWAAGAFEIGSLVVYNGDVYKASQAVLATDVAPGAAVTAPAVNPWVKVNISGGVKTVATDSALPAGAANGAVFLVLSSARAGGKQSLYSWDAGASAWNPLGGGGIPLALGGGKKIVNVGVPIGTVIDFAGKTLPAGYLLCDGKSFDQTLYPTLFTVLGGNTLPDLRNQFVRGANTLADVSFVKHDATTGMPKTHFTGVSNSTGSHTHTIDANGNHTHGMYTNRGATGWKGGGNNDTVLVRQGGDDRTTTDGNHAHTAQNAGAHQHTVEITAGGDAETAPMHVILAKIIKADDINQVAI